MRGTATPVLVCSTNTARQVELVCSTITVCTGEEHTFVGICIACRTRACLTRALLNMYARMRMLSRQQGRRTPAHVLINEDHVREWLVWHQTDHAWL